MKFDSNECTEITYFKYFVRLRKFVPLFKVTEINSKFIQKLQELWYSS